MTAQDEPVEVARWSRGAGRGGVLAPEASRWQRSRRAAKGHSVARALVPGSVSWGRREWVTHTGGRLSMFEVRIHGRGGQGVVTAAGLLSVAAFLDGKYAQAFPSFGSERTGAPVAAFCRIDDKEIRLREPVTRPDALIVQDATLLHQVAVFDGVAPSGYLLINSMRTLTQLGLGDFVEQFRPERVLAVPATDLAREHLGRPVPNMVLLGAFAALTGQVSRDSMVAAIHERFTGTVADGNVAAVRSAFDYVRTEVGGLTDVAPN